MNAKTIYIDDSGDPGLANSNTSHLIIAAVIPQNQSELEKLSATIDDFRASLGWNELDEFKFSSTRKSIIETMLKLIQNHNFTVYALVINKAQFKNTIQLLPNETLYNYAIKELLIKIKSPNSVIAIDGVTDRGQIRQTRTYLRQALKAHGINNCKINLIDSKKDPLIQLADIVAGSIARSFNKTKTDSKRYTKLLSPKIKGIYKL